MPLVLGADSSTQSTTIEVRDAETGKRWGSGRWSHPETTPPRSEQQPAAWWAAFVQAVHEARRYNVAAISVAGQQHGLVALDRDATPVYPAKLWNDTESADQAAELLGHLGAEGWAKAVGTVPVSALTVTKLAWLRERHPDAFQKIRHVLLPHDWLTWRLTGRMVTDRGDASGTGYWSPAEGRWRPDVLRLIDPDRDWVDALPTVLAPTEPAGPLDARASRPLGLEGNDVIIGPGTGDNMATALAVDLRPGDVLISLGTSGVVSTVSERPTADSTGAVSGFADATGRWLPLVCTLNATKVTDTFARLLGVAVDQVGALALQAPAGAGGLVLVPFLDGERTPNRPSASGTLLGLRTSTTSAEIARAAIEGVICGLLDGLDALAATGLALGGRLILVGGGARSEGYRQVLADLAQRPVFVPEDGHRHTDWHTDWAAVGACVQAAAVLLGTSPEQVIEAWGVDEGTVVNPVVDPDTARQVRAAYQTARDYSARYS
jgi:xylulokinase